MTSLGYSSVPGTNHSNQVLQPNIAGGANPSNSHFTDPYPQFSSNMGATAGCIGPTGGSAAALKAIPGDNMVKQTGGRTHVRGGYKKRHSKAKKSNAKKVKKTKSRKHAHRHRRGRRSMRGGLSSLSPAPFSGGVNAPYHQFTGGEPISFNYSVGGSAMPLPFNEIGTAPNRMTNIHNNCGSNHGLVKLIN